MPRVEPWIDKSAMVKSPTLYDVAHAHGLTTAQVDWVAIYNAPTITWEFRERPPAGAAARLRPRWSRRGSSPRLTSMISLPGNILFRDQVWTNAARHILRQHKPNLLLFHLLTLDSTQHRYGPRTQAAMNTMALLDTEVAAIVQTLEDTGLAATTTLFVVSDHGFKAVKRQILPNAALLKGGLLEVTDGKVTRTQAYVVPEGGSALVYITVPDPSGQILAQVKRALAGLEGHRHGRRARRLSRYGLPMPSANDQMGALFLTAKEGYAFAGGTASRSSSTRPRAAWARMATCRPIPICNRCSSPPGAGSSQA